LGPPPFEEPDDWEEPDPDPSTKGGELEAPTKKSTSIVFGFTSITPPPLTGVLKFAAGPLPSQIVSVPPEIAGVTTTPEPLEATPDGAAGTARDGRVTVRHSVVVVVEGVGTVAGVEWMP
jgi:hypothetical protein